ncbi:hypothetical protein DL98DRAFT_522183 [Cadophora sp. DSE1049]|uniref:uncharacterized protein n=1 Tax=Cadophora gregata TaxID=51156 RepID=UPI000D5BB449|nr:uncharacterized protein ONS95_004473 [Cadophora gregata]KAK0105963.1 hypothetical protein ONS95_004473 [Cadophora gregata]PVH69427.1 hypothetical protein DL98DRAFT_522183 [Cadophora sp. DSE1049]
MKVVIPEQCGGLFTAVVVSRQFTSPILIFQLNISVSMPPLYQQQTIIQRQEDSSTTKDINLKPFILLAAVIIVACLLFLHILERRRTRAAAAKISPPPLPKGSLDQFVPKQLYRKWLCVHRQNVEGNTEAAWAEPICAICLDKIQGKDMVRVLGCSHVFHAACLERWYSRRHDLCPLCRACYIAEPSATYSNNV